MREGQVVQLLQIGDPVPNQNKVLKARKGLGNILDFFYMVVRQVQRPQASDVPLTQFHLLLQN